MYFYLYSSRVLRELSEQELMKMQANTKEIIDRFRITGLLLYHKNHIVHYFEGEDALVKRMYQIISEDKRLADVRAIREGVLESRLFAAWSMKFRVQDHEPLFTSQELQNDPGGIKKIMGDYCQNV